MSVFETGIVTEVFGLPRPEFDVDWYDLVVCAERPGPVPVVGGASLHTPYGLAELAAARTVIVPGVPDVTADPSPELIDRAAPGAPARCPHHVDLLRARSRWPAPGLLDGRRATTHWQYAELLARRYPLVEVDPDVLYLDDGDLLTSAGSAAGLDLCVHVVRRDHGAAIANAVARRLVIPPHRDGGQAQFVEAPVPADPDDDRIAGSIDWALAHLAEPLSVAQLAGQAHMSPRTYLRHFARATGTSPIRWLIDQRVRPASPCWRRRTPRSSRSRRAVGFDTPVTYRHHFGRLMLTSPSAYRRAFRTGAGRPA